MLQTKQKGFTLLELLVVITLLAVLSVGALIAYEGIGENASNVAAANNIKVADSAIRTYRALENEYPNQWDNLANYDGNLSTGAAALLAPATKAFFGQWAVDADQSDAKAALIALANVGVNEFQTLNSNADFSGTSASPNELFNESAPGVVNPADELEWELNDDGTFDEAEYGPVGDTDDFYLSIVPSARFASGASATCQAAGADISTTFAGGVVPDSAALNRINDGLEADVCHLVIAAGFGKDVPGTTLGSRVAISTAPTYTNGNVVNPSIHYARYIALFHVGSAEAETETTVTKFFNKARLLAVVDTEGRNIDQAIAGAFASDRD